ncbi:hypothetical protein VSDG_06815 [Cytospora chrysosperma]|uniref:Uncharacterized protein n=1 Tax=Cytospora chrysosperma TaxID=252740 RepID=A0A423VRB6_CYTCH|nr:hypothetical protein VSDG_06815 [Valsa sordida]
MQESTEDTDQNFTEVLDNTKSRKQSTTTNKMPVFEILDSKFSANRTGLRTWRELRFIGNPMWSQAEEDQLRRECLALEPDGLSLILPLSSNATLWAAAFDRYGVPLSDLFTYGLKPHPSTTRGPRATYLTPLFCQFLIVILVHPVFQAKIDLVRHVLQHLVCLRMGVHQPPVGPAADISDDANTTLDLLADVLYNADETMGQIEAYHGALWLYIQELGIYTHPEIVDLLEVLRVAFKNAKASEDNNIPGDNTPYCRNLFFLQLWDLQFLLQVLNDMASPRGYLPAEEYHKQWLRVTRRVRPYIESKVEGLAESWFLLDERNHRVRQKLIAKMSGRAIYDIGEEDFRPLYARSELITVGMRSILCGDFLKPLCPSGQINVTDPEIQEDAMDAGMQEELTEDQMQEDLTEDQMQEELTDDQMQDDTMDVTGNESEDDVIDSEMQSIDREIMMQNTHNDIDTQDADDDIEMQAAHDNIARETIEVDTNLPSADREAYIPPRKSRVVDDSDEYEPSISGDEDEDGDYEPAGAQQANRRRSPSINSIASFYSISSSKADEWEPIDDDPPAPRNEHISRRGLPQHDRHKPMFRRRQDHE